MNLEELIHALLRCEGGEQDNREVRIATTAEGTQLMLAVTDVKLVDGYATLVIDEIKQ